ncbi:unnamed protein product [Mucor circinelloides]|uniref:BHLH domain-containing protein n=1 Tax=Mucor circinelloides f. circinelloides (strain 1006PhL) TaxID=1220926 RepID=S2JP58_MUCC1|nr:hypothetical protein HMPREF1544_11763 [Mucor circinelloides 1006PhL]
MSEIILSNSTAANHYDYSNGSMMVNINPGLVQKTNSSSNNASTSPVTSFEDNSHHQYTSYPAYAFQPMPMGFPPVPNYHQHPMSRLGYFNDPTTTAAAAVAAAAAIRQPNSPESISSSSPPTPSPPPPSTINSNAMTFSNGQVLTTQAIDTELINPLVPSSSTSTSSSASTNDNKLAAATISNNAASATTSSNDRFNNPATARVKEMITRANSVPMEFYHTEFLEYSKETYEKKMENKRNKRKRPACTQQQQQQEDVVLPQEHKHQNKKKKTSAMQELKEDSEEELDEEDNEYKSEDFNGNVSSAEIRRQIHIQSEQKRRAQIKDGFDELRKHLPGCNNKKMSKAALLTRTVQQLQHLKGMQNELLSEVERLLQENESLKKFQHGVLQRQAMEKMYTF